MGQPTLTLRALWKRIDNGRPVFFGEHPPVEEHNGIATSVAPRQPVEGAAHAQRGYRHSHLVQLVRIVLYTRRKRRIVENGHGQARHQHAGRGATHLIDSIPEAARAKQHDTRLVAEHLPELARGTVDAVTE